jgi:hypothetical protein
MTSLVRILEHLERWVETSVGAVLRGATGLAARLLGRGRHRDWRRS